MADGTASKRAIPSERYGDTRRVPSGKLIIIGIVAMVVACVAYILVQMDRVSTPDVTATPAGWARAEGHEEDVFIFTLDVTREQPEQDAYCIIYALNYDMAEVGRRDVIVPGSNEPTVRLDVPVRTREQAVAGDVYGCSTDMPALLQQ
ncbi:DUF4307 domain-containing protein [Corynebacterium sp. TAE3-ERU12]|uniref:DUF4307 domain-containing protein n=1 Tax=Corynebacterium sp. TAE3-ERU12 TaxID=2849491 RepID=UPI001C45F3D4|nr:DUF4307 domain-containing protein [Corynebacterium sp. TAE3-ERU12]MBV7295701.1 DUF4307 domain-containing protein [Corynebacterium sp. TAE3-ERU12]